jgi:hypothetical protein
MCISPYFKRAGTTRARAKFLARSRNFDFKKKILCLPQWCARWIAPRKVDQSTRSSGLSIAFVWRMEIWCVPRQFQVCWW